MYKHSRSFVTFGFGAAVVGAALLMSGCGGSSVEKSSFGTYQNAVPAAYGIEATAADGNISSPLGGPFFYETSGLGSADGSAAYLTAAEDFAIVKNPNNATLLSGVDPNGTGKIPFGFSGVVGSAPAVAGFPGQYIDANTATTPVMPAAVTPGASVVFRAAISNGVSSSAQSAITINPSGVSLSSQDPEWTLGVLPLTFNYIKTGPFANATYVTGTPVTSGQGTPTPFTVPFTTTGIHSVILTVTDDAGQQTATTFAIPVVKTTDAAVLAGIQPTVPDGSPKGATASVVSATATITNPVAGVTAQTTADAQDNVLLFAAPGAQTITVNATVTIIDSNGAVTSTVTQTATFPVTLTAGGTMLPVIPVTGTTPAPPAAPAIRSKASVRSKAAVRH